MDAELLLNELCVRLGFCLEPEPKSGLLAAPPLTVDAFTDAVIQAEGLDPLTVDRAIRHQVRTVVARHMGVEIWDPKSRRGQGHRR